MKRKWTNWRIGVAILAVAVAAAVWWPRTGVREIHNASRMSNFALVDPRPRTGDWSSWRGADARNVAGSEQIPKQWSATDHEGWQVAVPGLGHATPIVWGDQLFLLTAEARTQQVSLLSYERHSGRALWQRELHRGGFQAVPEKSSHASTTPTCDGQFVYSTAVIDGSLRVTSVDLTGRIVWQREAGPFSSTFGYNASPTLHKSLVIVAADQYHDSYLAALHRQTGEIVWRVKRPRGDSSGSPVIATIAGRTQLILAGKSAVISYDPVTGDELWKFRWSADRLANSIAFDDNHVFATCKHPAAELVCIKADGTGDITRTHLVWQRPHIGTHSPSPVYQNGFLYVLTDEGRLNCLEALTGKTLWRKQLDGTFSASPVIANDHLLCSNESGSTSIVSTGAIGEIVSQNALPEAIIASPIVVDGAIIVRTVGRLHRIASPDNQPLVEKTEPVKRRL